MLTSRRARTFDFACQFAVRHRLARTPAHHRALGAWTKERLVDLGPIMVKLGQMASVRADLFEPEFLEQLESLQDEVPPMRLTRVRHALRADGILPLLSHLEPKPHRAASLGQVHRATLRATGQPVCVKIQREGVEQILQEDTQNLTHAVQLLERLGFATGSTTQLVLQETCSLVAQELDYRHEAKNATTFRKHFIRFAWVRVPKVLSASSRAIVMQWLPGIKITDLASLAKHRISRNKLATALTQLYVLQITEAGFFHADPHPGNLAVTPSGRLVVYDFGILVHIQPQLREAFPSMLSAAATGDTRKLVQLLIDAQVIIPGSANPDDLARFLDHALATLTHHAAPTQIDPLLIQQLAQQKPFDVPVSFVFLARTLALIQSIILTLNPQANLLDSLQPHLAVTNAIDIRALATSAAQTPARIERISADLDTHRYKLAALSNDTAVFGALLTAATLADALQIPLLTATITVAASIVFIQKRKQ